MKFLFIAFLLGLLALTRTTPLLPEPDTTITGNCVHCKFKLSPTPPLPEPDTTINGDCVNCEFNYNAMTNILGSCLDCDIKTIEGNAQIYVGYSGLIY